jgi:PPK2 family polyphosphate:nucleotide phosphotransferase
MKISNYIAGSKKKFRLKDFPTSPDKTITKSEGEKRTAKNIKEMIRLQDVFYASQKHSLLIIFQALDAAGKDGTIKHVMSGLNPQGTAVHSFKQPSAEELSHDYLWRAHIKIPPKGMIGIFNRSYYEDVLVVRVHNLIDKELYSGAGNIWEERFRQINDFEKYLFENGTHILKFFLYISKEEQAKRFIKRIDDESKNWKFSEADIKERSYWNDYQDAIQETLSATSAPEIPWYIIPSDKKWFTRLLVSEIIVKKLKELKLIYPELDKEQTKKLRKYRDVLSRQLK